VSRTALRAAVIGSGMIGGVHRRAIAAAGATVVGVLGSSAERSRAAGGEWGVRGYADLDELLADRPDVVHVCTPNATHVEYALAVIGAGIHVVVEKPLATSVDDATRLADAAAAAGVVATVPFVYRFHPLVRELRARRIAGEFGDLSVLHGSYLQDWLVSPDSSSWRVDAAAGGASRAFGDIGSHWCDLVEFVSGERFTAVSAVTSVVYDTRPAASGPSFGGSSADAARVTVTTEDTAVATFRTAGGVIANTVISQVAAGRKNRLWFELDGSKGSAVFDQENPESVWLGGEDGSTVLHRGEGRVSADQARLNRAPAGHPMGYLDAFAAFVADTYAAIGGERPEGLPTFADGVRSAIIIDAVLTSAASATWTEIHP
jgi:predicted dehydrogenase